MKAFETSKHRASRMPLQAFFSAGTQARQGFFQQTGIQPRLAIGRPGDRYEQEADAMAEQVVAQQRAMPGVQPKCPACEAEEDRAVLTKLQRQGPEEEEEMQLSIQRMGSDLPEGFADEEEMMQRKDAGPEPMASSDLETRLQQQKGSGSPLPQATQHEMGEAFGADFSSVRVHTGNAAVQMNQELHAHAFTHGSDVYFNSGTYDPGSQEGKKLLAHELTHVVQQGATS